MVNYLVAETKFSISQIDVEVPLTRASKGNLKRADIVVYKDEAHKNPLLVIECKKNDWGLTDRDEEQVKDYSRVLGSNFAILTNGTIQIQLKKFGKEFQRINAPLTQARILSSETFEKYILKNAVNTAFSYKETLLPKTHSRLRKSNVLGVDTDSSLSPFVANLTGFFYGTVSRIKKSQFKGYTILKDLGVSVDSIGNAAGGGGSGDYRKLLVKEMGGDAFIVAFQIFASFPHKNDATFGNTNGNTYLVVAIDKNGKRHNSLQLNLDRETEITGGFYLIKHRAAMTHSNRGPVKIDTVKKHIKKKAPHLIGNDGKILLGKLPTKKLFKHTDKECKKFIANLIEYAVLRDEIRKMRS